MAFASDFPESCFTTKLVFGSSTSVTRLNLFFGYFVIGSHFFKKPAGIVCIAFETFSKRCILLALEIISFLPIISYRITGFAHFLRMFSRFYSIF